jgi:hypothetical protein
MLKKSLFIITLILFLLINTAYYWEGFLGGWNMLIVLIILITYLILFICVLKQIYLIVKEKLKNELRIYTTSVVMVLLILIAVKPYGIIDFGIFEAKDVLIAGYEGVASCTKALHLKEDRTFYVRSVCFGVSKSGGSYTVHNDTIKFSSESFDKDDRFEFGVFKRSDPYDKIVGEMKLYRSKKDTIPMLFLNVYKNELLKK